MLHRRIIVGVCLIAMTSACTGAQKQGAARVEQVDFTAEAEAVQHPVPLPDDVLKALAKDDVVQSARAHADPSLQTRPSAWFSAAKVDLSQLDRQDLVVLGEGPLTGANVMIVWIFRDTGHGYELVLRTGGHDLHIKRHRSNGYRDVETDGVTMVQVNSEIFRFNGKRYVGQGIKTQVVK